MSRSSSMRALAALLCVSAVMSTSSPPPSDTIFLVQSSEAGDTWTPQPSLTWGGDFSSTIDVTVNRSSMRQEVLGFGAAFTDTSAYNVIEWMSPNVSSSFYEAMWGVSGLGLSVGRITLNSADYSFQSFNYDNVTDDFSLANFDHSLAYDHQRVIPMIRRALATSVAAWGDEIRLFASPWSPPGWMKGNLNMIDSSTPCLRNDTSEGQSYKLAWATYISYWIAAMENAGIPLWGLTPQNEPEAAQKKFESCVYSVEEMVEFVGTYLGPAVKAQFPNLRIMGYDHNKLDALTWAQGLYGDAVASQYVDGIALHWYDYEKSLGLESVDGIAALAPGKFMLGTEACLLEKLVYGWRLGELYAVDILADLTHGVGGWCAWNHVLLCGDRMPWWLGGPNHDNTTTFGDPVLFEFNASGTQRLILQSSYYILGHVSRYARPGSHVISSGGAGVATSYADFESLRAYALGSGPASGLPLISAAFLSPDDSTVNVVVVNVNDAPASFKLRDVAAPPGGTGVRAVQASIPGHAIQTYSFAAGQ